MQAEKRQEAGSVLGPLAGRDDGCAGPRQDGVPKSVAQDSGQGNLPRHVRYTGYYWGNASMDSPGFCVGCGADTDLCISTDVVGGRRI